MKKLRVAALAALVCLMAPIAVWAYGSFSTLPGIGGAAYCVSTVSGVVLPASQGAYAILPGSTQGTGQGICAQTVPAGPPTFAGTEYAPFDVGPLGANAATPPATAAITIMQLGQGPMVDVTSPATATIAANTSWYFLDGAQGSAFTITMPAAPYEGYIQHVVCEAATVGVLTVAANTNQTLKANPAAACVAGVGYAWRYQASNTTWYRIQ